MIQFKESEITIVSFVKNLSTEAFNDALVFFSVSAAIKKELFLK